MGSFWARSEVMWNVLEYCSNFIADICKKIDTHISKNQCVESAGLQSNVGKWIWVWEMSKMRGNPVNSRSTAPRPRPLCYCGAKVCFWTCRSFTGGLCPPDPPVPVGPPASFLIGPLCHGVQFLCPGVYLLCALGSLSFVPWGLSPWKTMDDKA